MACHESLFHSKLVFFSTSCNLCNQFAIQTLALYHSQSDHNLDYLIIQCYHLKFSSYDLAHSRERQKRQGGGGDIIVIVIREQRRAVVSSSLMSAVPFISRLEAEAYILSITTSRSSQSNFYTTMAIPCIQSSPHPMPMLTFSPSNEPNHSQTFQTVELYDHMVKFVICTMLLFGSSN